MRSARSIPRSAWATARRTTSACAPRAPGGATCSATTRSCCTSAAARSKGRRPSSARATSPSCRSGIRATRRGSATTSRADPLRPLRAAAEAQLRAATGPARGVLHVIHGHGGGTEHHARALIDASRTECRHYLAIAVGDSWQIEEHLDDGAVRTFDLRRRRDEAWPRFRRRHLRDVPDRPHPPAQHLRLPRRHRRGARRARHCLTATRCTTSTSRARRSCSSAPTATTATRRPIRSCAAPVSPRSRRSRTSTSSTGARGIARCSSRARVPDRAVALGRRGARALFPGARGRRSSRTRRRACGRGSRCDGPTPPPPARRPLRCARRRRADRSRCWAPSVPTRARAGSSGWRTSSARTGLPLRFVLIGYMDVEHGPWQSDDAVLTVHGRYEPRELPRSPRALSRAARRLSVGGTGNLQLHAVRGMGGRAAGHRPALRRAGRARRRNRRRLVVDRRRMARRGEDARAHGRPRRARKRGRARRGGRARPRRRATDAGGHGGAHARNVRRGDAVAPSVSAPLDRARVRDALGYVPWTPPIVDPPLSMSGRRRGAGGATGFGARIAETALLARPTRPGRVLGRLAPRTRQDRAQGAAALMVEGTSTPSGSRAAASHQAAGPAGRRDAVLSPCGPLRMRPRRTRISISAKSCGSWAAGRCDRRVARRAAPRFALPRAGAGAGGGVARDRRSRAARRAADRVLALAPGDARAELHRRGRRDAARGTKAAPQRQRASSMRWRAMPASSRSRRSPARWRWPSNAWRIGSREVGAARSPRRHRAVCAVGGGDAGAAAGARLRARGCRREPGPRRARRCARRCSRAHRHAATSGPSTRRCDGSRTPRRVPRRTSAPALAQTLCESLRADIRLRVPARLAAAYRGRAPADRRAGRRGVGRRSAARRSTCSPAFRATRSTSTVALPGRPQPRWTRSIGIGAAGGPPAIALPPIPDANDAKRLAALDPDVLVDLVGLACAPPVRCWRSGRHGRSRRPPISAQPMSRRSSTEPKGPPGRFGALLEELKRALPAPGAVPDAATMASMWESAVRAHQQGELAAASERYAARARAAAGPRAGALPARDRVARRRRSRRRARGVRSRRSPPRPASSMRGSRWPSWSRRQGVREPRWPFAPKG